MIWKCAKDFLFIYEVFGWGKKDRGSRASRFATSLVGIYRLMTKGDDKEKKGTTTLIFF